MTLKEGDIAPDFSLPASNGENVSLNDYKGKKVVIYFYPCLLYTSPRPRDRG